MEKSERITFVVNVIA